MLGFGPVAGRPIAALPRPIAAPPQLLMDSQAVIATTGDADVPLVPQLLLDSAATVSTLGDTDAPTVVQLLLDSTALVATVGDADLTDIPTYVARDVPAERTFAPTRNRRFYPVS